MKAFIVALLAGLALYGCSTDERSARSEDSAPVHYAIDPVTGAEVRTDTDWKTHWNGSWYYFESEENRRRFKSDPTAYIGDDGRRRTQRPVKPSDVR